MMDLFYHSRGGVETIFRVIRIETKTIVSARSPAAMVFIGTIKHKP